MSITGSALPAVAADDVPFCGNELAGMKLLLRFFPDFHDLAGKLVTKHEWRMDSTARPVIPVCDVQIRPTDSGVMDANQDVRGSAGRDVDFRDGEAWFRLQLSSCRPATDR